MKPYYALLLTALTACGGNKERAAEPDEYYDYVNSVDRELEIQDSLTAATDSLARLDSIARADSVARVDSLAQLNSDNVNSEIIRGIYKEVFSGAPYGYIREHSTPEVLSRLRGSYDSDVDDGTGDADRLGVWELRTQNQDGPSSVSKVTDITPEGNGWYKVSFLDMGNRATRRLRIVDGRMADYR